MSKIAFTPNASGTGTFSIASPGTNTDRTLTLPDATGTVVLADAAQTLTNKSIAASQLTGALPAISGEALTNLPAPTSAQVGTATAGLAVGDVGTYAWLGRPSAGTFVAGTTYAGSGLRYAGTVSVSTFSDNTAADVNGATPAGTWMAMGSALVTASRVATTIFLRIS